MSCITREEVKAADDKKRLKVSTEEWKPESFIFVQTMTAYDRDQFEIKQYKQSQTGKDDGKSIRADLVIRCACDEEGKPLFTEKDHAWLSTKSATVMDRLYEACMKVNQYNDADIEELTKN